MIGWAPKEYNPGENMETGMQKGAEIEAGGGGEGENGAPQSGFVWDEASGYYYDAASGFYYDGNRGNVFFFFSLSLYDKRNLGVLLSLYNFVFPAVVMQFCRYLQILYCRFLYNCDC